jgi:hypothetical protein
VSLTSDRYCIVLSKSPKSLDSDRRACRITRIAATSTTTITTLTIAAIDPVLSPTEFCPRLSVGGAGAKSEESLNGRVYDGETEGDDEGGDSVREGDWD